MTENLSSLDHGAASTVEAAEHLRATHLFGELSAAEIDALAGQCARVELRANDVLIEQGDSGDRFYVAMAGRLLVTQRGAGGDRVLLGEVRKGEYVGEIALLDGMPRMATVRAATDAQLLGLSRDGFQSFVAAHPHIRESLLGALEYRIKWAATRRLRPDSAVVLQALSDFTGGLGERARRMLEAEVEWVTLPRGATLMKHGEPGDCLYFVVSGRLRIYGVGEEGVEVEMNESGPGESLGEMALLSSAPRSASASALRDCELLRLSKRGFEHLLAQHPETMGIFTRIIIERLNRRTRARAAIVQLRAAPLASEEECEEITRTQNLVLRNLKITQMYHRLSLELTLLLGHQDANWCTFACSASKTAGYSIRREEIPLYDVYQLFRRRDGVRRAVDGMERLITDAGLAERAAAVLAAVSDCISAGNLKVFAELAPVFARFVRAFQRDVDYDPNRLVAFVATLHRGPTEGGGQDHLIEALSHYYDAMFEPRPKRKTELILLGNIKIGLHEQTRLQPNIVDALNAPLRVGMGGLLSDRLSGPAGRLLPSTTRGFLAGRLASLEESMAARLTGSWRKLVTRSMMTLRLPYGEVRLGADVPRLPNEQMFPDMLHELVEPELLQIVRQFDSSTQSLTGSRASDWGHLGDRMNYIIDLFRSRQKSLELFDQPFQMEQRMAMAADRLPVGRL